MMYVNKKAVALAFSKAAKNYTKYNELQRRSSKKLFELLKRYSFTTVLDAGCGPGNESLFWRELGKKVTALDLSIDMLLQARKLNAADDYLIADIEFLPIAEKKFDLVWSHLAVQWCNSLSQALSSLYRVTRVGGYIAFTTLLSNSLHELNQAWLSVDQYPHSNRFLTKYEVEDALFSWKHRSYIQHITLYFRNARSAMQSLKGIGATHLHCGRSKQFLTRKQLENIEKNWPRKTECYPLTYYLFHGIIQRD